MSSTMYISEGYLPPISPLFLHTILQKPIIVYILSTVIANIPKYRVTTTDRQFNKDMVIHTHLPLLPPKLPMQNSLEIKKALTKPTKTRTREEITKFLKLKDRWKSVNGLVPIKTSKLS